MTTPACPVCGATETAPIEVDSPPYAVLVCGRCDAGFVAPSPPEELLLAAYDEDYYAPWEGEAEARRQVWEVRFSRIAEAARGPLLDVGCGNGGFLEFAVDQGLDVEGTEFSADAVRDVHDKLGVPMHQGELTELGLPADRFQTVTMWHVLEHTRDPRATLDEVFRIMAPGGLLVVAVPNRDNKLFHAAYRIARGRKLKFFDPGDRELHLFHFTPKSLAFCIEASGFRDVHVRQDRAQFKPGKRAIERVEGVVSSLTRAKWWSAQMAVARKP